MFSGYVPINDFLRIITDSSSCLKINPIVFGDFFNKINILKPSNKMYSDRRVLFLFLSFILLLLFPFQLISILFITNMILITTVIADSLNSNKLYIFVIFSDTYL